MPKKLYTPEQRLEKKRERSRNYQRKKRLEHRILRYASFLCMNGYTIMENKDYQQLEKFNKKIFNIWICSLFFNVVLLILLFLK